MQVLTEYSRALSRKYPEPVAIAIARDAQGKFNPITLGWTMLTSHEPPMMAISIGQSRYSLDIIRQAGEWVVSFPSSTMRNETLLFGTNSGRDMDKLTVSGAKTQPATAINGVILADAVANFECTLVTEVVTGDHVLFVGRVAAAHMNEDRSVKRLYSVGHELLSGVRPDATS